MTVMTEYTPGIFSWVDLGTTDGEGAKKFYSGLFGWEFTDFPTDDQGVYSMGQIGGKSVAALYQMGPAKEGMPPAWNSYVTVANAQETAEKAKALGGNVLAEPFDVMGSGIMAMIQEPTGAVCAIWEPKEHIGAEIVNEPNTLTWNELATPDSKKAGEFLTKLFDWSAKEQEMPHTVYTTFSVGERMNAGMLQMTEEWGDMPAHWMAYFATEDCDAMVKKAEELGGEISVPPTDIPEVGRFSVIKDPQGAHFSVIKLVNPE